MFRVKICGITTVQDALLAAEAGADAIGLNFVHGSPRCVNRGQAADILLALGAIVPQRRMCVFGVSVNWALEKLIVPWAFNWQLHGDEPPELITSLRQNDWPKGAREMYVKMRKIFQNLDMPNDDDDPTMPRSMGRIVKAFRVTNGTLEPVSDYLQKCQQLGKLPHAVLLDAYQPGAYGGTGQKLDWSMVRAQRDKIMGLPLILAGGLTPENVAEAIATARPDAVDVSSGVESSPGRKDPAKVRAFVAAAKKAFEGLDS